MLPVEHAVPFEVRPWRTAAILASAVAALELLALIVAVTVLLGRSVVGHGAQAATKQPTVSKPAEARPGDIRRSVTDPTLAERELGWRAEQPLEDGLRLTWESLQEAAAG